MIWQHLKHSLRLRAKPGFAVVTILTLAIGIGGTASPPDFADWRRDNDVFAELAGLVEGSYALTGEGAAEQIPGASITGGFFTVMGTPAAACSWMPSRSRSSV